MTWSNFSEKCSEGKRMTLTEKDLREWQESAFTLITAVQRRAILKRFGTEPWPYEWTEQDIAVQIRNFLDCGEFVRKMRGAAARSELPPGVDF
jgi:hypothetical protein